MGEVVQRKDYLFGCSYWIIVYKNMIPRFEVFRFIGEDRNKYYFRSRDKNTLMGLSYDTFSKYIHKDILKPFIIDHERMNASVDPNEGGKNAENT